MRKILKIILWIATICLVLFVSLFSWVIYKGMPSSQTDDTASPVVNIAQSARGACRQYVRSVLNDPNSADWGDGRTWQVHSDGENTYIVNLTVRATNGFGALVLSNFECELYNSSGSWSLVDLKEG